MWRKSWFTALPRRGPDESTWSLLRRPDLLETLRSLRRELAERWISALISRRRHDRYTTGLRYAAAYAGTPPVSSRRIAIDAFRAALPRLPVIETFNAALSWSIARAKRITAVGAAILAAIAGALVLAGGQAGLAYTNEEQFCISCHEMRDRVYAEYKGTVHDSNRTGVRATCPDCHVPREARAMLARKVGAAMDLYSHFISGAVDSQEKFEDQRYRMARAVWLRMKESDSRECRNCHDAAAMSSEVQSAGTRARHARGKAQGKTCIDCHFGIAHKEPAEGPGPQELTVQH